MKLMKSKSDNICEWYVLGMLALLLIAGSAGAAPAISNEKILSGEGWLSTANPGSGLDWTAYFRYKFSIPPGATIIKGSAFALADDDYDLYVNGKLVFSDEPGIGLDSIDFTDFLKHGDNVVAIRAQDTVGLYEVMFFDGLVIVDVSALTKPIVDINITGVPLVGLSTKNILAVDYGNFTAGDPYNITITRISDSLEVFADSGTLTGVSKQTIPIDWTPKDTSDYLVVAKGDTIVATNKITVTDSEVVAPVPELLTIVLMSTGILGLFGLTRFRRRN